MFKRLAAAVCCLVMLLSAASASGETLYVQVGSDESEAAFLKKHPEVTVEYVDASKMDTINMSTSELNTKLLTGEIACDAYSVYTSYQDVQAMIDKGFVMDLSSSQIITDAVNRMWPSMRDQVMKDGKIYGVPSSASDIYVLMCREEEFRDAGFDEQDVPHSFEDFLDFLDNWIARNEEEPQSFQIYRMWDYTVYDQYTYTKWLVDKLMTQYIMQLQYAGKPLRFDDPRLVEFLERCATIGAKLAEIEDFEEPMYPGLFDSDAQARFYWGKMDTWSAVTSVYNDQPRLLRACLKLDVVNAGTDKPELAIEYLEDSLQHPWADGFDSRYLYTDVEPIVNEGYEEETLWWATLTAMATDQLNGELKDIDSYVDISLLTPEKQTDLRAIHTQLQDESPAELRDQIDRWQHYLDEMPSHEYELSPEQIADYAKFAPTLFFPAPSVFSGSLEGRNTLFNLEDRFSEGQISAQQMCRELNRVAEMMELEAQ